MKKGVFIKRILTAFLIFILIVSNSVFLYAEEADGDDNGVSVEISEPADDQSPSGSREAEESQKEVNDNPDGSGSDNSKEDPEDPEDIENPEDPVDPEEPGNPEEPQKPEEPSKPDEPVDPDPYEYKLKVNNDSLSFGTIGISDSPRPLSFVVTNDGEGDISLGWSQTDASGIFLLNMPSEVNIPLAPGNSIQGSVEVDRSKLSPGDYSTTILFSDLGGSDAEAKTEVSLRVEKESPAITRVKISPSTATLKQGYTMDFNVTVEGRNDFDKSVSWKIQGNNSGDTSIDGEGYLTVADDETAGSITVIATSNADNSFKDTAKVDISKNEYVVNAYAEPSEGGYITGKGSFKGGERTTLTAIAEKGYRFSEWLTEDGDHVSGSASFTTDRITGDLKYKAKFEESGYEIKVKSSDKKKGSVTGGGFVEKGKSTRIEAIPKEGYKFEGWYENDRLLSRDKKVEITNVQEKHTFTAEFKKENYVVNLAAFPEEGGNVIGGGTYKKGSEVLLKADPKNGYHFKGYVLNNQVISESEEFKIKKLDRDLSITAYFEKDGAKNHKITSGVANKGGVISPSGETTVTEGNSLTYIIAPDNGYGILAVSVDGEQVGPVSSFTFNEVKKDHTISVAFAPKADAVNEVKMDKILTPEEVEAITIAKLEDAPEGADGKSSHIITPEEYAAMSEEEKEAAFAAEGDTETLVVPQEQNLVGMENTAELKEVVEGYNPDTAKGVYQALDIKPETAEMLIDAGGDDILINEAYELGLLDVMINSESVVPGKEGELLNVSDGITVKNLQEVIKACLTREEKLQMFGGEEVLISLTIAEAENPGEYEKSTMKDARGVSIDRYLYITLTKTIDGTSSLVEKLDSEMTLTFKIPDELKGEEYQFCVVRNHNGEIDVLEDQDDDPDTITISTDRFSPYAIAHHSSGSNMMIFVGIAIGFALTLLILVSYITMRDKKKA